jgi:hypothetical protein
MNSKEEIDGTESLVLTEMEMESANTIVQLTILLLRLAPSRLDTSIALSRNPEQNYLSKNLTNKLS